ncbi:helix-turn-helix transcriptional regulator [Haladaptatus sp. CMSO5]|uniref:helix-turn-helix transcriptional regulator n=1 Tax=Haladaptatus sp. CMSO5 TaxID=3120514 RepID=UPI002FCE30A5
MMHSGLGLAEHLQHFKAQLRKWQPTHTGATSSDTADASTESERAVERTDTPEEGAELTGISANIETPADVLIELGQLPAEFVVHLLEENGGQLKQKAFTEYTSWSPSTISRLLTEVEEEGHIVRVQIGIEKIVYLPEAAPTPEIDAHGAPNRNVSVTHD